jgi:hypothetical protein
MRHVPTLFLGLTVLLSLGVLADPQSQSLFGLSTSGLFGQLLRPPMLTFAILIVFIGFMLASLTLYRFVRQRWQTDSVLSKIHTNYSTDDQ